jgi:hypothetical protein
MRGTDAQARSAALNPLSRSSQRLARNSRRHSLPRRGKHTRLRNEPRLYFCALRAD